MAVNATFDFNSLNKYVHLNYILYKHAFLKCFSIVPFVLNSLNTFQLPSYVFKLPEYNSVTIISFQAAWIHFSYHHIFSSCLNLFQSCAYDVLTGSFIGFGQEAGTFASVNQLIDLRKHQLEDLNYRDVCCERTDLCDLYWEVRPLVSQCYSSFPFSLRGRCQYQWILKFNCIVMLENRVKALLILRF